MADQNTPVSPSPQMTFNELVQQGQALVREGRFAEAEQAYLDASKQKRSLDIVVRLLDMAVRLNKLGPADTLRDEILEQLTAVAAQKYVPVFWRVSRQCWELGSKAASRHAAVTASMMLDAYNVLEQVPESFLVDGLLSDGVEGDGNWSLRILREIVARGLDRRFLPRFFSRVGGLHSRMDGKRKIDLLADSARK